jgi:hypothetical protein
MPRAANALSPQAVLTGLLRYLEGSGALTDEKGQAIAIRAKLQRIYEATDTTEPAPSQHARSMPRSGS